MCLVDPVLPQQDERGDLELERKLQAAGVSLEASKSLCAELMNVSAQLTRNLEKEAKMLSLSKDKVVCKTLFDSSEIELRLGDFHLTLSAERFRKLSHLLAVKKQQQQQHQQKQKQQQHESEEQSSLIDNDDVSESVLACICRYYAVSGCNKRAGGMQAAIPPDVFDVLEKDFDVSMECFASPLNCNWPNFCSAFEDVDHPFGSRGSFFSFVPKSALSLEANPPFDANTIILMTTHMERLLLTKTALSFTVIVPCWERSEDPHKVSCWKGLLESRFCRHHLLLPQAEHAFCEGSQLAQYHISNADTSIFFLQNVAASKMWEPSPAKLARLQHAFRFKKTFQP